MDLDWLVERVPLTLRHRYDFTGVADVGPELDTHGWDKLRLSGSVFGMDAAEPSGMAERAQAITDVVNRIGAQTICSYGCGTGLVERRLLDLGLDVTLTESAPRTVAALRERFPKVANHNILDGPKPGFDLHLMHRADAELTDPQWMSYLRRRHGQPHLFVLSALLDWPRLQLELRMRRERATVAGWIRSRAAWNRLAPDAEWMMFGDLHGFLLP